VQNGFAKEYCLTFSKKELFENGWRDYRQWMNLAA